MVEIPVEKKSQGIPWWTWLIGLLVIGALAWFFLAGNRDDNRADRTTVAATAPAGDAGMTATGGTITSLSELTGDAPGNIGRQVSLSGVQVVSADETGGLYIGDDSGQRVFVSTSIPSGFGPGSMVNVTGTVQGGDAATAGRSSPPAGLPAGATHYIEADSIQPA